MIDHDWSVEETGDATLVEVVVRNPTGVPRRVRVENRLDGPALPPGSDGVPDAGWDEHGYEGTVPPNDRLTLGYACAAAPSDPPVEVVDEGRAPDGADDSPDAADAVRLLGDHAPPVDALPSPGEGANEGDGTAAATGRDASGGGATCDATAGGPSADSGDAATNGRATGDPPVPVVEMVGRLDGGGSPDDVPEEDVAAANGPRDGDAPAEAGGQENDDVAASVGDSPPARDAGRGEQSGAAGLPDAAASWLADVEGRVEAGERLTGDATLVEAATVVEERGGVDAAAALPDRLAADERALRALADRADDLADRAAGVDVPVAALRRLS